MRNYSTLALTRKDRILTISLNRPDVLNAVNLEMHDELAEAFHFAAIDDQSDIVILTGAGRTFCAGTDAEQLARNAAEPERFDHEARIAKRLVFAILDLDKPLICRMNGNALGLGATLALLCDVVYAVEGAKIGDPHVCVGLVAGDGAAAIWAQRIGLGRAKEYLLTGEPLSTKHAEQIGLINHCVIPSQLDDAVHSFCVRLLHGSTSAVRWTKVLLNLELKRVAHAVMDAGIAYESITIRSADHREAVKAIQEKRRPIFCRDPLKP
ncbi:enoyl-CoA hydratase/isomerase family protein [Steroidobacter sp.]|uniref:enoyl-CoA hydratase/isomerase family protein n=1 Tax=Steroidobacter sp. TaxID=1978227 RepID=UPI001A5F3EC7|nr:enoyl-CoA hydratase-related protein [Steroidobacter sp.]MBL8271643.1 enoyl-CoA hydratase/isomerase family protein [Steroidobacter sp.]